MFGPCVHCKWQSPSSHRWWLKRQRLPEGAVRHQSYQNHLSFSLSAPMTPPLNPEEPGPWPPGVRASSWAHTLTWHCRCQEQKLLIRENAVMRYFFFLFVLLDKSIISSLSYQDSGSSTILFLPLTDHPLPTPGTHKAPSFPSSSHPRAVPLLSWQEAIRQLLHGPLGPDQGELPPCGQVSVPFVLFSANTRTEREARINSQTDTKQRDRETAI